MFALKILFSTCVQDMKMSGLDGSGEMSLGNLKVEIAESNVATLFAQDIVSEVLQKALTIASQLNESKLTWNSDSENFLIGAYVKNELNFGLEETDQKTKMETEKTDVVVPLPCKDLPGGGGVGDQPITLIPSNATEVSDQPAPEECNITTPVEKKSRVADLVKSSKQVLSAYIMDDKAKRIRDKFEEEQEQFLQVIELDSIGAAKIKQHKRLDPTEVPLPDDDDDLEATEEFFKIPATDAMDTIDLKQESGTEGENQENIKESVEKSQVEDGAEFHGAPSECTRKATDSKQEKKNKWNFGARLMQFFKRPKQKARGTQTATRK